MNKNATNNELTKVKTDNANPGKTTDQEKIGDTKEQTQPVPGFAESMPEGHVKIATEQLAQDAEPKPRVFYKFWHKLRDTPAESKNFVIGILGFLIALIAVVFSYFQWQVAKQAVDFADKQWKVADEALRDARAGASAADARAERLTKANEALAEAAKRQAETNAQISKSGEASASAARRSAQISEQALIASNRAFISVDKMRFLKPLEANQQGRLVYEFVNDGNNPAEISGFNAGYFVSELRPCANIKHNPFDLLVVAPKSPRTQTLSIIPISQELLADMRNCDNNGKCKKYFQMCISASYTTLGGRYTLEDCSYYYPVLDTFLQCKKQ